MADFIYNGVCTTEFYHVRFVHF